MTAAFESLIDVRNTFRTDKNVHKQIISILNALGGCGGGVGWAT